VILHQLKMKNRLKLCLRYQLIWVATLILLHYMLPRFGMYENEFDIVMFVKHGICLVVAVTALFIMAAVREKTLNIESRSFNVLYQTNKCISILILAHILTDYSIYLVPSSVRI
jgi:hypothetical protein